MPFPNPAAANAEAIALRSEGRLNEAVELFREAIRAFPNVAPLQQNLAQTLYEAGDNRGAIAAHEAALRIDPASVASNLALYELLQIVGETERALVHQREALRVQSLFSSIAPHEARSVLVLCAPGDWQANIPIDFLLDRNVTTVHKLYLGDESLAPVRLPEVDVVWNSIAEGPTAALPLEFARRAIDRIGKASLNSPERVLATSRTSLPRTLASTRAVVAPIATVALGDLSASAPPFAYPIIVRPVGSHAGHGLERIASGGELARYAKNASAREYFVSPFVDYRSEDGLFRKYRIIFVDGEPYPCHLAISPRWMIHYYNAAMAENQWMRDEEARFLADLRAAFDGARYDVLREIAESVGLEYFGIDAAIDRDGRILVFEADPAMLVHSSDPIELYPYKHEHIPRIYRAVERMIDRRRTADT